MCSGFGRVLPHEEKLAQVDSEIALTQQAMVDAQELPARLAWLQEQRALLLRGPQPNPPWLNVAPHAIGPDVAEEPAQ